MRSIDHATNWFWQQGYYDGVDGRRAIVPDETRHSFQRSDYFAGYAAGQDDRAILLADIEERGEFGFVDLIKSGGIVDGS